MLLNGKLNDALIFAVTICFGVSLLSVQSINESLVSNRTSGHKQGIVPRGRVVITGVGWNVRGLQRAWASPGVWPYPGLADLPLKGGRNWEEGKKEQLLWTRIQVSLGWVWSALNLACRTLHHTEICISAPGSVLPTLMQMRFNRGAVDGSANAAVPWHPEPRVRLRARGLGYGRWQSAQGSGHGNTLAAGHSGQNDRLLDHWRHPPDSSAMVRADGGAREVWVVGSPLTRNTLGRQKDALGASDVREATRFRTLFRDQKSPAVQL